MPNYGDRKIALKRGEGSRIWDTEGREYLDFLAGISVNNLGHCHPAVVKAVQDQVSELMHCSNLYLIPQQVELAKRLCELTFADQAFFCNSGGEANEGAIKLARLYSKTKFGNDRYEIITLINSFHGRTLGTIAASGQEKIQKGFEPLPVGFVYGKMNDLDSIKELISSKTCAIMLEPIQGEGGVTASTQEFIEGLRRLCDDNNLLLIFDEIQCGMGRTGKLFAHQYYGVDPDIMTVAKGLGNGFPIGGILAKKEVSEVLTLGTHGTTFGGNPLACAAGLAVLDVMTREDIPGRAAKLGEYFRNALKRETEGLSNVIEFRGIGLMVGIVLSHPGLDIVKGSLEKGLIINCTMGNVLRILPPLTVSEEDCDTAARILGDLLRDAEQKNSCTEQKG